MTMRWWMGCNPRAWDAFPEAVLAAMSGRGFDPFDWDGRNWGSRGGGGRGGRRGRRRMFNSGELRLVLLSLIADEPRHGYDLIRAIEELTAGGYAPSAGVIYPTLNLLEDSGMIARVESGDARKAFEITEQGRAELESNREQAEALIERLAEAGGRRRERSERGGAPVGRAIGNVMAALGHRLGQGHVDADTRHAIADILDEAARRIERI